MFIEYVSTSKLCIWAASADRCSAECSSLLQRSQAPHRDDDTTGRWPVDGGTGSSVLNEDDLWDGEVFL